MALKKPKEHWDLNKTSGRTKYDIWKYQVLGNCDVHFFTISGYFKDKAINQLTVKITDGLIYNKNNCYFAALTCNMTYL